MTALSRLIAETDKEPFPFLPIETTEPSEWSERAAAGPGIWRDEKDAVHELERALASIPDREHHALRAYYFHDCSWTDIGRLLDVSHETARHLALTGIWRLRLRLRGRLGR